MARDGRLKPFQRTPLADKVKWLESQVRDLKTPKLTALLPLKGAGIAVPSTNSIVAYIYINASDGKLYIKYTDGTTIRLDQSGGGVTDHGALTGLGDPDHNAIYYTEAEVDALLHAEAHGAAEHSTESDAEALHDNVANEITGITNKTPVAADEFVVEDSAASYVKKAVLFSALEGALTHDNLSGGTTDSAHHTKYTDANAVTAVEAEDPLDMAGAVTAAGVITGLTIEATGDTSAGDNAAIGYTAAEGLILTGQGSTYDVAIKNDADVLVMSVSTGTTSIIFHGFLLALSTMQVIGTITGPSGSWNSTGMNLASSDAYSIDGSTVLSLTTLGGNVVNSSLTSLGTQAENLVMGSNKITGVTAGSASGEAVEYDQLHAEAHGPSQHTTGTAWRDTYQDASGDDTEIAFGAAGTYKRSAGASAAPTYSAILDGDVPGTHSGSAHHGESHDLASHSTKAHSELSDAPADAHHTKYTGSEAITAVEGEATLDLTGALTATSYGGITEANLVDKSAAEAIAGKWDFDDYITLSEIAAPGTDPAANTGWLYVKDDGGTSGLYFEADDGVVTDLLAGGGAAQDVALLDGSEHNDTVAQAVTRGSLIYGNATPKWDEFVVGTGVLAADGTDVTGWTQTPILAGIQDASETVTILHGDGSSEANAMLKFPTFATGTTFIMSFSSSVTSTAASQSVAGISAILNHLPDTDRAMGGVIGLSFTGAAINNIAATTSWGAVKGAQINTASYNINAAGDNTVAVMTSLETGMSYLEYGGSLTVTIGRGIHVAAPSVVGAPVIPAHYGIDIDNQGSFAANMTRAYGLRIVTVTGATHDLSLYIGSAASPTGNYGIFVDNELARFDGDGTRVFELPADATDPTGGGGAAIGRVPVLVGGVTRHFAYY